MKQLHIREEKGEYYLDLIDGVGSMRLAKFNTPMAMGLFYDLYKRNKVVPQEDPPREAGRGEKFTVKDGAEF